MSNDQSARSEAERRDGWPVPASVSEDPKVFVIRRELSEVHLLLDNLAANSVTNLSGKSEKAQVNGLGDDWVDKICAINWPPDETKQTLANQASLLIRAKDYLNSLTYPASGGTIAFTLLVTQESQARRERRFRWLPWRSAAAPDEGTDADVMSRHSMAAIAYPDLIHNARHFARLMFVMSFALAVMLVITSALSWYVAGGNIRIDELKVAQSRLELAQKQAVVVALSQKASGGSGADGNANGSVTPSSAAVPPPGDVVGSKVVAPPRTDASRGVTALCDPARPAAAYKNRSAEQVGTPTDQDLACQPLIDALASVVRAQVSLAAWLSRMPDFITGGATGYDTTAHRELAAANATALANILGTSVLPFLYGLLGAATAVVRAWSRKTKHALLAPRDYQMSLQQLALGAVPGACIGLFFGKSGAGDTGLLGAAPLSNAALSFVAGFGADSVFKMLEELILRVFNIPQPATPVGATPGSVRPETPTRDSGSGTPAASANPTEPQPDPVAPQNADPAKANDPAGPEPLQSPPVDQTGTATPNSGGTATTMPQTPPPDSARP